MTKIKAESNLSPSVQFTSTSLRSLPFNLTGREIKVLLKNALNEELSNSTDNRTNRNSGSQKELNASCLIAENDDDTKRPAAGCSSRRQSEAKYVRVIGDCDIRTEASKPTSCLVLMDLVFEEFQLKDVVDYIKMPLNANVGKVYIFDEKATRRLDAKCNFKNADEAKKSFKSKILKKETCHPPPLPAKPKQLTSIREHLQTFPMHKASSLMEPMPMKSDCPPMLPRRNNPTSAEDTVPIPPVRTTSKTGPSCATRMQELPEALVRAVEQVIENAEKQNSLRDRASEFETLVAKNEEATNVLNENLNISMTTISSSAYNCTTARAFNVDNVPFADDPDSLDYPVELSEENLSAENSMEDETTTESPEKTTPKPSCQFNTLPKISAKTELSPNRAFSKSYHDLDSSDLRKEEMFESDEDEATNHYEKIPYFSDPPDIRCGSISDFQREKQFLRKNDLVVVDKKFLDFEVSATRRRDRVRSDSLLKTLSHQYELLDEFCDETFSCRREKGLTTVYDREGNMYFVPKYALKEYSDSSEESWFYPIPLTMMQASCFLRSTDQFGSFMVYQSADSKDVYYLSVCLSDEVIHYKIEKDGCQDFGITGGTARFHSLRDLVNFYRGNRGSLLTRLKRSLKEVVMPIMPGYHYDLKYEVNRKDIKFTGKLLGFGHFGTLCIGMLKEQNVSVEVLEVSGDNIDNLNIKYKEDGFIEMATILATLDHQNIIKLVGLSCQTPIYYFITEYSHLGDLKSYMQQKPSLQHDVGSLLDTCFQMTSGLSYLASKSYVIHRNVTCKSFLVFEGPTIKLAEFHKARYVIDDLYVSSPSDPICVKWASPEILLNQTYTTKSDVWALAVSMWEVFSLGKNPYPSLSVECAAQSILEGATLTKPKACPEQVYNLMLQCWRMSPLDRPRVRQINRTLAAYKVHFNEEFVDSACSDDKTSSNSPVSVIPHHEAPTAGIVKLRQKFFSQRSRDSLSRVSRAARQAESVVFLEGDKEDDAVSSATVGQTNHKKEKKNSASRLFSRASMSDLSSKFKQNDPSKSAVRKTHSKSFQAESSNHFENVLSGPDGTTSKSNL